MMQEERARGGGAGAFAGVVGSLGAATPASSGGGDGGGAAQPSAQLDSLPPSHSTTAAAAEAAAGGGGSGGPDDIITRTAAASPAAAASCPPDTAELGRATWTFLHSVGAYYPVQPTPRQQDLMHHFMEGLAEFYPCEVCAEHLREQVRATPPRVASRLELNMWLCGIHNEVNELLGKPTFDCNKILQRWRDGPPDGSCD